MKMLYRISNIGCDDYTECDFEFTDKEAQFLRSVFEALNEKSEYACMPTIYIQPIDEKGGE